MGKWHLCWRMDPAVFRTAAPAADIDCAELELTHFGFFLRPVYTQCFVIAIWSTRGWYVPFLLILARGCCFPDSASLINFTLEGQLCGETRTPR